MTSAPFQSSPHSSSSTNTAMNSSPFFQSPFLMNNSSFNSNNTNQHTSSSGNNNNNNNNNTMNNNNAHRFLSRYEGFDSAKLSQRTDELQRRFGLVSSVEEEKKPVSVTRRVPVKVKVVSSVGNHCRRPSKDRPEASSKKLSLLVSFR